MDAIKMELERMAVPIWATLDGLHGLTGVPEHTIRRLAEGGAVRSAKLGECKQASRVYRVADLLELLDRAAAAGEPVEIGEKPKEGARQA